MPLIQPQDFLHLTYPAGLTVSPDGAHCAWLEFIPDLAGNTYHSRLVCSILGEAVPTVFGCVLPPASLTWEDSSHLLYPSSRGGRTQIRRMDLADGSDRLAADIPGLVLSVHVLKTGCLLLLIRESTGTYSTEEVSIFDEIPFWANGRGITNGQRTRLYLWDFKTLTPITPPDAEIGVVSAAEDEVLYSIRYHLDRKMKFAALCRYDLVTGTVTEVMGPDKYDIFCAQRTDGGLIVCATDMDIWGNVQNPDFYLVLSEGIKKIASPDFGVTNDITTDARYGTLPQWASDGAWLYFIVTTRAGSRLCRLDCDGAIEPMTPDDGRTIAGVSAAGGSIAFVQETAACSGEVFLYSASGDHRKLSCCGGDYFSSHTPTPPEHFTFISGGEEIDGYVLKPVGFDPQKRYPGVLQIHGGPKLAYGQIFHMEMQAMAAKGWFVFFCNPHGSDGRSSRFMDLRGQYGSIDFQDLMEFTDQVLKRYPQIDRDRTAACGGSYGGFMVNWIIGHTSRFCCAVSQRSISNWVSMFCTGDTGYRFVADQIGGTPWNEPARYFDQSPLQYADRVATPTLFIHSDQDYRCFMAEGLQMFTALRYFGVESRFCLLHGENHELSRAGRPRQRLKRLEEIFDWLEQHF